MQPAAISGAPLAADSPPHRTLKIVVCGRSIALGDEAGDAVLTEDKWHPSPNLRLIAGLRGNAIAYDVRSELAANSDTGSAAIVTPKAALASRVGDHVELYASYVEGYRSNDVRLQSFRQARRWPPEHDAAIPQNVC